MQPFSPVEELGSWGEIAIRDILQQLALVAEGAGVPYSGSDECVNIWYQK